VESLEDLAKKENPYKKKIKLCKSYCGGLDGGSRRFFSAKTTISKKASSSCNNNSSLMVTCRPPHPLPVQKYF